MTSGTEVLLVERMESQFRVYFNSGFVLQQKQCNLVYVINVCNWTANVKYAVLMFAHGL